MGKSISHSRLANWYVQLGQALDAGISFTDSIANSSGPPRKDLDQMESQLRAGRSIDEVLGSAPAWLPQSDCFLLSAAGQSGRLPDICLQLAAQHRELDANKKQVLAACAYPVGVLHLAVFSMPLPAVVTFSETGTPNIDKEKYLTLLAICLGSFWGILWLLNLSVSRLPRLAKRLQRFLPGLRRYAVNRSIARFAWALDALLSAGVVMKDAFGGAALIADDPVLTPQLLGLLPAIERGHPPGSRLAQVKALPSDFVSLYQSGERTGHLDVTLNQLMQRHREEAAKGLTATAFWYPKLVFVLIAIGVGIAVIFAFSRYLDFLNSIME